MERKNINQRYKWDLKRIYEGFDMIESDIALIQKTVKQIHGLKGKLTKTKENFIEYLDLNDVFRSKSEKLYIYATFKLHLDMSERSSNEFYSRVEYLLRNLQDDLMFINPEILGSDENKLLSYIENTKHSGYSHSICKIFRVKKHQLNEEQSKILNSIGSSAFSSSDIFNMFNNVDIDFGKIRINPISSLKLTHSNASRLLQSKKRKIRKTVASKIYLPYKKLNSTLSEIYKNEVRANCELAKLKKHANCRSMFLFSDNIPEAVYDNVLEYCKNKIGLKNKYFQIRQKALNYKKMYWYDISAPIIKNYDRKFPFDMARDLFIKSVSNLGDEYTEISKYILDNNLIDVYSSNGKMNGGYQWGSYDTDPYILLNYENTYSCASTLSHEMGHAAHTALSNKYQKRVNAQYPIFLAEIASTVNEVLLAEYILKTSKDVKEKIFILNQLINTFLNTMYTQCMFASFEKDVFSRYESDGMLSASMLNDIYSKNEKQFSTADVIKHPNSIYGWSRIPHFYKPFYVYQYATGIAAAWNFADSILNNDNRKIRKYLNFLKSGGNGFPLEILKEAGIDMTTNSVYETAFNRFENYITLLENYLKR